MYCYIFFYLGYTLHHLTVCEEEGIYDEESLEEIQTELLRENA